MMFLEKSVNISSYLTSSNPMFSGVKKEREFYRHYWPVAIAH